MAATAIVFQSRRKPRELWSSTVLHFSSSSSSDPNADHQNASSPSSATSSPPQSKPGSSFSSCFNDVKASLKQQSSSQQRPQPRKPFSLSSNANPSPSRVASLEEIQKNLFEFRRRSAAPTPDDGTSSKPISFQELYKRNVISKGEGSNREETRGKPFSFDVIRESLSQLRSTVNQVPHDGKFGDAFSLSNIKNSSKISPLVFGGSERLPPSVFGKEMREEESESPAMKTEFVKMYSYGELGDKLRMLRPEGKKGEKWFSLNELNERLMKLREIEEKESDSRIGGTFKDLRQSLVRLRMSNDEKARKTSMQRLDILSRLGGTPSFHFGPPKEHLIEKYFHLDNMSTSEKLKLKLRDARDEFKMSENDCGSSRVQVVQLTTKIKHLSGVLHKKDKHSRKGLQGMVQKRKKLLKYLRRTDWDSYCLVLSKLGLRDNPELRN